MADSNTTTYSFTLPEVGASADSWGTKLNANWDKVDDLLDGSIAVNGITVTGGSIDGTPVGATTPSTGAFTTVTTTGNVGIGTSSPTVRLELQENTNSTDVKLRLRGFNSSSAGRSAYVAYDPDSRIMGFGEDGNELNIDASGNVGIGTASPSSALSVATNGGAWTTSSSDGVGINYNSGNANISTYLDNSTLQIGAGVTQKNGMKIYGQTGGNRIEFQVAGSERARIDSSGNLLVGKTSANSATQGAQLNADGVVIGAATSKSAGLFNRLSTDGTIIDLRKDGSTVGSIGTNLSRVHIGSDDCRLFFDAGSTNAVWPWADTATSSGDADNTIDLGDSANRFKDLYLSGAAYLQNGTGGSGGLRLKNPSNNTNAKIATFTGWNNTETGNISTYVNVTSYNTSSDYRLKEDIVELPTATDDVMSLKPCNFAWKGTESRMNGFIAHELAEIVPEAVTGEKDAMRTEEYEVTPAVLDDNGNVVTEAVIGTREVPEYQSIDQSKLVPLLTKALQEAITKIEQLETRIETLENK